MADRTKRLTALRARVMQQVVDAECLLDALEEYCREHPDDKPCAANDPSWPAQVAAQRDELRAMVDAIDERRAAAKCLD